MKILKLEIMNADAEALKPIVSAVLQGRGGFSSEILSASILHKPSTYQFLCFPEETFKSDC